MKCPRCETTVLDELVREGSAVNLCPSCHGVWLDPGELEGLISNAIREFKRRHHLGGRGYVQTAAVVNRFQESSEVLKEKP